MSAAADNIPAALSARFLASLLLSTPPLYPQTHRTRDRAAQPPTGRRRIGMSRLGSGASLNTESAQGVRPRIIISAEVADRGNSLENTVADNVTCSNTVVGGKVDTAASSYSRSHSTKSSANTQPRLCKSGGPWRTRRISRRFVRRFSPQCPDRKRASFAPPIQVSCQMRFARSAVCSTEKQTRLGSVAGAPCGRRDKCRAPTA